MQPSLQLYSGKRVLLTGHTGFKGAWLLMLLRELGAEVAGYALAPESPSLYGQIRGEELCRSTIADLRDEASLRAALLDFRPDFVFHLAAQPLVLDAYERPVYTFEVNALGTARLLECVRGLDQPCTVVVVTTDKVYENREWEYPYRENDGLGGYDPYSSSKACTELITASYRSSFFNPADYARHGKALASARAGNVIGGGDWAARRIIPDIIRALQAGTVVELRHPRAVRPWQHVLEALYGYLLLGARLQTQPEAFGAAFNFGPLYDEAVTVEQLVQSALRAWGGGSYRVLEQAGTPHEAGLLRLDCSRAVAQLGWRPRWSAAQAVEQTMFWYGRVLQGGEPAARVCLEQISAYLQD